MTNFHVNIIQTLVFAVALSLVDCEFKLHLLHTNDMHARFQETNARSGQCYKGKTGGSCYGGFARLKTAVNESIESAKAQGYNSIFLNAGDSYQGTVFYTMFKWEVVADLVNLMEIDVMSLGNHEFDDGPKGLAPYLEAVKVPVVGANVDCSKEPAISSISKQVVPSQVLDVNGVKVGVIGYLTPETMFLSHPGNCVITDEVAAITKEVEKLKKEGVNILIAVGHSGYPKDMEIARLVPDLDVVVGGHTNTFLYSGTPTPDIEKSEGPYPTVISQASGRKVLVVTAYAYTKYLGHLLLTFDDNGEVVHSEGQPILVNESFKKDGEVERAVLKYANIVKEKAGQTIGKTKTFLEADDKTCRLRECNFGNLVTDAIVHENAKFIAGNGWTDAPVAFVQGGSLRTSIDNKLTRGDITLADLLTTLPFQNSVEKLVISGDILMRVLEHSVDRYSVVEKVGAFMQFSGVMVQYDLERSPGERVVSAVVRCGDCNVPEYTPLDHSKQYNVLTLTFLADGGDDYTMLKEASERNVLSFTDVEAVQNLLKDRSPVHPENQNRIILLGSAASYSCSVFTTVLCLTVLKTLTSSLLHS